MFFRNYPYNYTINLTHGQFNWKVVRTYKNFKDAHNILAEEVKKDLGYSCSEIHT
jgi:hypothetical protein